MKNLDNQSYQGFLFQCAPERSWTVTAIAGHRILSPACLPIPPPGQYDKNFLLLLSKITESRKPHCECSIANQAMKSATQQTMIVVQKLADKYTIKKNPAFSGTSERKTGLEPATPTLARSCSTKWATSA